MDELLLSPVAESPAALPAEEAALVERLRGGDERAFEELVRTHGGAMLAVARRLLADEADAADAVQDAFISTFRAMPKFAGQSRLGTWLYRIAVNAALAKLRKKKHRERSLDDLLPKFHEDGHQLEPPTPWSDEAETGLLRNESRAAVRAAIEQLPDSYRTVLLLRDIDQFDTDETARLLEVSPALVKTRLHRARQALRTLLDPYFRGDVP